MENTIWADITTLKRDNTPRAVDQRSNLDKDAFLRLLLTELKYQDPLNPTDDKEFIAQMAQFSALEQMQNVSKAMNITQGMAMIGKNIKAARDGGDIEGIVESVVIRNSKPYLVTRGGEVAVDSVEEISELPVDFGEFDGINIPPDSYQQE
ncbi:MAG: hypothetical protein LBQ68_08970 [Clostridiales bacterium]|jgi:flagellar basal-body rod modification protein FlgD|nr:hypothetical protein [Clostridiales bacterium]